MDDLRRMGRGELVEIIYQLRRALDEKDAALADCRKRLAEKRALDEQNALTKAMRAELRAAVDELRGDVSQPMRAQIDALKGERDALKNALNARNAAWTNAGSLAEAVVAVNGLMQDAQRAADQYLADVKQSERAAADIVANAQAEAARIANEFAQVAGDYISDTMLTDTPTVLSSALEPVEPVRPRKKRIVFLAGALTALAAIGVLFAMYVLDDKVKTSADVQKYTGALPLAVIPISNTAFSKKQRKQ